VAISFPGSIVMEAPFKTGDFFFRRDGSLFYVGGGNVLAAFGLEKR
jgi:surface antigen